MTLSEDLTGKQFGRWTVLKLVTIKGRPETWLCRCTCGHEGNVRTVALTQFQSLSCGCLRIEIAKRDNFLGQRFGRLTVLYREDKGRVMAWRCCCDCGKQVIVASASLRLKNRGTRSCGCIRREQLRAKGLKTVGPLHPSWKGGRTHGGDGYIFIIDGKQKSGRTNYTREHIVIMRNHLGRPLLKEESVHHRNGIRTDNRIENLELWASNHPHGQRVADLVKYAKEILMQYEPAALTPVIERPD